MEIFYFSKIHLMNMLNLHDKNEAIKHLEKKQLFKEKYHLSLQLVKMDISYKFTSNF